MLNPDGVINGNYRTDLTGEDLNRRYTAPTPALQPTVYAVKELLREIHEARGVFLYVDMHGHSRKKNIFIYGCDGSSDAKRVRAAVEPNHTTAAEAGGAAGDESAADDGGNGGNGGAEARTDTAVFVRTFPALLDDLWPAQPPPLPPSDGDESPLSATVQEMLHHGTRLFSYSDSSFHVHRSKWSTGRVVAFRELGIRHAYTLEASFCGAGDNREQKVKLPPPTPSPGNDGGKGKAPVNAAMPTTTTTTTTTTTALTPSPPPEGEDSDGETVAPMPSPKVSE